MSSPGTARPAVRRLLVVTRTAGYRHTSIPDGLRALREIGLVEGFETQAMADATTIDSELLRQFAAVAFLSTSDRILAADERAAFATWLGRGGGFVGIHSASTCEDDWPEFEAIVGARFAHHREVQRGVVTIDDADHPSTASLPQRWPGVDEWYNFQTNPRPRVRVLASIDEATIEGGTMGADHPIAWSGTYGLGRTWYTGLGHTSERYDEPLFRNHLAGGVRSCWADGALASMA